MATLAALRTRSQQYSDNVGSSFIAPAEWTNYINAAYAEVYGAVVQQYGNDYYVQTPATGYTFVTTGLTQYFALPTDFFKLLGVDVLYGSANQWIQLKPFAFEQRNMYSGTNQAIPAAGQTVRLFYIPKLTALAADPDVTIDLQNDWEDWICISAAIMALTKEESDISALAMRKAEIVDRMKAEPQNRDAGNPMRIVDSRGRGSPTMAYRINGANLWLIGQRVDQWGGWDPSWGWGW